MKINQVNILEREEIKLVGFSVDDSLNNIFNNRIVGRLREELVNRKNEVVNREGEGIYLIQIYPDCQWTPDVPYTHIVAFEVTSYGEIPNDMVTHSVPAGRFAKFVHKGPESEIGDTYAVINEYSLRPFDIEYWEDIYTLENPNSQIDIYIPVK
ncbi:GyrI-like domain-containing protein [Bacillus sp. JJ1533]|uniref:GyrI-like domain-containing protein n=1 Tax=Bacillus sp. JJ1533 TaxID=3122959 RepID=UPI002FFFFB22